MRPLVLALCAIALTAGCRHDIDISSVDGGEDDGASPTISIGPTCSGRVIIGGASCAFPPVVPPAPAPPPPALGASLPDGTDSWAVDCVQGKTNAVVVCLDRPSATLELSSVNGPGEASCDDGVLLGGGISCGAGEVATAYPASPTFVGACIGASPSVTAICISGAIEGAIAKDFRATNGTDSQVAPCPASHPIVIGGGCRATDGSAIAVSTPRMVNGRGGWVCEGGKPDAAVVCVRPMLR